MSFKESDSSASLSAARLSRTPAKGVFLCLWINFFCGREKRRFQGLLRTGNAVPRSLFTFSQVCYNRNNCGLPVARSVGAQERSLMFFGRSRKSGFEPIPACRASMAISPGVPQRRSSAVASFCFSDFHMEQLGVRFGYGLPHFVSRGGKKVAVERYDILRDNASIKFKNSKKHSFPMVPRRRPAEMVPGESPRIESPEF